METKCDGLTDSVTTKSIGTPDFLRQVAQQFYYGFLRVMKSAFEFKESRVKHRTTLSIFIELFLKAREKKILI